VIVALGGGSFIDSAKVYAAAGGDFGKIKTFLETQKGAEQLSAIPLIAVPTTADTGSEVNRWGTVWDKANGKKYSLARPNLYPTHVVVDPRLMLGKPLLRTISTGLDALSRSLESLWNVNDNSVSNHAVFAARNILDVLPKLVKDLGSIELRARMAMATLHSLTPKRRSLIRYLTRSRCGMAFSMELHVRSRCRWCCVASRAWGYLRRQPEADLWLRSDAWCRRSGRFPRAARNLLQSASYKIDRKEWRLLIEDSLQGERGRNFFGSGDQLIEASQMMRLPEAKTA
jgi:alcohol dehydrogenase